MPEKYRLASTSQMKEIDRIAIEEYKIPSLELMENAAEKVAEAAKAVLSGLDNRKVLVLCGTGNNGGDGFAAARILAAKGYEVKCYLIGSPEKCTKDCKANIDRLSLPPMAYTGQSLEEAGLIIDAIFGVGLNRDLEGLYAKAVLAINASGAKVISCDIPSGINGDSGRICKTAVKADYTITFSCSKPGLEREAGLEYAGEIKVVPIGIPEEIIDRMLNEDKNES